MRRNYERLSVLIATALIALPLMSGSAIAAKTSATDMITYTQYPLFQSAIVPPISLLAMSRDHQLFNKAYTDYTNLDSDPEIETTYDNGVNYSGYFDPNMCYSYVTGSNRFEKNGAATNHLCSNLWSGNFLNWSAMTRIDILRWVLYGGKRSTGFDTSSETVLERALIPSSGHAYVKVYQGTAAVPISGLTPFAFSSISMCHVSPGTDGLSQPVMQVAQDVWRNWAGFEGFQCNFLGGVKPPTPAAGELGTNGTNSFVVRVKVCDGTLRESFCRTYNPTAGTNAYKPAGLLQEYGETANGIQFGLISGTYDRPRTGGVLRSNVGPISNEVNPLTGILINQTAGTQGIINTIDRFRMVNYARTFYSDCDRPGIGNDELSNALGNNNRKCANWGNPIGEIYAEALRYFANSGRTPAYDTNDSTNYITGLPTPAWVDPLANKPRCTGCSIIVISTGLNSFDRDELTTTPPFILNGSTVAAANTAIGVNEALSGQVLIGASIAGGATDNQASAGASTRTCSAKTATFGTLSGVCPEVPSLQGGYDLAALSKLAFLNDFKQATSATVTKERFIRTYTLSLAETLPRFDFDIGGGKISVLPQCQSTSNSPASSNAAGINWKACSIVNFELGFLAGPNISTASAAQRLACQNSAVRPTTAGGVLLPATCSYYGRVDGNTPTHGSFVINWEDSTWGNDYDMDAVNVLTYCVGSDCTADLDGVAGADICKNARATSSPLCTATPAFAANTLYLRSEIVFTSAGFAIKNGWVTAGASVSGADMPFLKRNGQNRNWLGGPYVADGDGAGWDPPQVRAFTPSGTSAKLLENPLFYAAKYGNFEDTNGDGEPGVAGNPASSPEWDAVNLDGMAIPDGIPDNYFPVRNPNLLKEQLGRVFARIAATQASGTSAAVVSSSGEGAGAVFQAVYSEETVDPEDPARKARWNGSVRGLWITPDGSLAEDSIADGLFTDSDAKIRFVYNPLLRRTRILRTVNGVEEETELSTLKPIWDAGVVLGNVAATSLGTNRNYTSDLAESGRYIATFIDLDNDGLVDANEQKPLEVGSGAIDSTNFRYFNSDSLAETTQIINFVRGVDQPGMRPRQLNMDADAAIETARLGDIVNSSPLVVGPPSFGFDLLYQDESYIDYLAKYKCRRSTVYVGANDGMVHAFNGGFRKPSRFVPVAGVPTPEPGGFVLTPSATQIPGCTQSSLPHKLGSELWAYAPGNLLAHLRWQTRLDYTHVFYVDGNPFAFDVKAFTPDSTHPKGWGTILVVPFRLGGGGISVQLTAGGALDKVSQPAFAILDVTDPESAPKLLAEVVLPNSGTALAPEGIGANKPTYSYGRPAVVFNLTRPDPASPEVNVQYDYQIIFGSGPTKIAPDVHSDQPSYVRAYNLNNLVAGGDGGAVTYPTTEANSFTSDMSTADFDLGGTSDALYFGTMSGVATVVGGTTVASLNLMAGGLFKMPIEKSISIAGIALPQPEGSYEIEAPRLFHNASPPRPVQGRPALTISPRNVPAVIYGTGRMLSKGDFKSTQTNYVYVLDDFDTFSTRQFQGTMLSGTIPLVLPSPGPSLAPFRAAAGETGFTFELRPEPGANGGGSQRSVTNPAVFRGVGLFTTFTPDGDVCVALGSSTLTVFNFANPNVALESGVSSLGAGAASDIKIYVPPQNPQPGPNGTVRPPPAVVGVNQSSTGALTLTNTVEVGAEGTGEQAWWQPL